MNLTIERDPAWETLKLFCDEIERRIKEGALKLPVLPRAIQKVLAMQNDPEYDLAELSDLIHQDQTLAGHVLKVSNSSIYAGNYKTSSLTQAISRLGAKVMVKIAVSITMQGDVFRVDEYREEIKQIWSHSLATAVYAQHIAEIGGTPDSGMYMCGLVHQVGKPVLLQTLVEISRLLDRRPAAEDVKHILHRYHPTVGAALGKNWKLPPAVLASCLHYLQPQGADEAVRAVSITHIASRLADALMDGDAVDELPVIPLDTAVMTNAGINRAHMDELLARQDEIRTLIKALLI